MFSLRLHRLESLCHGFDGDPAGKTSGPGTLPFLSPQFPAIIVTELKKNFE